MAYKWHLISEILYLLLNYLFFNSNNKLLYTDIYLLKMLENYVIFLTNTNNSKMNTSK